MKNLKVKMIKCLFAVVLGAFITLGANNVNAQDTTGIKGTNVQSIIDSWSAAPKDAAQQMITKYGQPQESTPSMLIWYNNGPWSKTIVFKEEVQHSFPMPHTDLLEQSIDYKAPQERFDELAEYDGSVIVDRTKGVMSARCDKEAMNFLALNLAHEVATGARSVGAARAFYAKTAMEFMKGQKSDYTEKLLFSMKKGATAFPDQPAKIQ